jgi:hypothetical protein
VDNGLDVTFVSKVFRKRAKNLGMRPARPPRPPSLPARRTDGGHQNEPDEEDAADDADEDEVGTDDPGKEGDLNYAGDDSLDETESSSASTPSFISETVRDAVAGYRRALDRAALHVSNDHEQTYVSFLSPVFRFVPTGKRQKTHPPVLPGRTRRRPCLRTSVLTSPTLPLEE